MADLLSSSTDESSSVPDADPKVVGLDSEDADDLIDALSSETARSVLSTLQDDPGTPSDVADRVDTSLQNVQYHLQNLEDAGAVEVVDTTYSEKGREMDIYAPANEPVVVVTGTEQEANTLRRALARLLGGLAVVAIVSLVVQFLFGGDGTTGGAGGGGGQVGTMDATGGAAGSGQLLPPGAFFFLGGAVVLLSGFALWYVRER